MNILQIKSVKIVISKLFLSFLMVCLQFSCQEGKTPSKNDPSKIITSVPPDSISKGSVIQLLKINNYKIETQVYTHTGESNFPTVTNKITLDGNPYSTTSDVKNAELYFYSDDRIKFKARYDSTNKTHLRILPDK